LSHPNPDCVITQILPLDSQRLTYTSNK